MRSNQISGHFRVPGCLHPGWPEFSKLVGFLTNFVRKMHQLQNKGYYYVAFNSRRDACLVLMTTLANANPVFVFL